MIHQTLNQLAEIGCPPIVIDGWGVSFPPNTEWLNGLLKMKRFKKLDSIEGTQQWKNYANKYRLVDDGIGIYHLACTVGLEERESPTA